MVKVEDIDDVDEPYGPSPTHTKLLDIDEEIYLRHFCLEPECKDIIDWCKDNGFQRPDDFAGRMATAVRLKELGNGQIQSGDFKGGMMHILGALHCLDFSQGACALQTDANKQQTLEAMVPVLSNLSLIFLKRGDDYNATRAADLGIERAKKLPAESSAALRAKLHFRRGLSKGQRREFSEALRDLREAAKLQPQDRELRRVLENCKVAVQQERGEPDDRWRGLLTEDPKKAATEAKTRRWYRDVRLAAREFWMQLRTPKNLVITSFLVLGPILGSYAPYYAQRWADGLESREAITRTITTTTTVTIEDLGHEFDNPSAVTAEL